MTLSQKEIDKIQSKIQSLKLHGFAGDCGHAAIKINNQIFDGKGIYVAALNDFWLGKDRWIGHVAVKYKNEYWDANGHIPHEEDFLAWGMIDPEDEDYQAPGFGEAEAYGVELYEVTENEIKEKFELCTVAESVLNSIIENIINEQWSAITSSHSFGKDRNGGNIVNKLHNFPNDKKVVEYQKRIKSLEPLIKQNEAYETFIKELGNLNPNDISSLYKMYQNFLGYFSVKREEFEIEENDEYAAALAIADYFVYHKDRLR